MNYRDITVGSYVILNSKYPCQIIQTAMKEPGKHGRRAKFVRGRDMMNDVIHDAVFDSAVDLVPTFQVEILDCVMTGLDSESGYLQFKDAELNDKKFPIDESTYSNILKQRFTWFPSEEIEADIKLQIIDIPAQKYGSVFHPHEREASRLTRVINYDIKRVKFSR